ncbi:hypothetical protein [Clostridium sp. ZBS18]|uniref:hypothetical protein n=1 Tax=Clostridium sp. ZBS18 TaxID=2949967 RepID=UPI00207A7D3E|nr:hypothetical protein [Clostridium sp. ZBS18]
MNKPILSKKELSKAVITSTGTLTGYLFIITLITILIAKYFNITGLINDVTFINGIDKLIKDMIFINGAVIFMFLIEIIRLKLK